MINLEGLKTLNNDFPRTIRGEVAVADFSIERATRNGIRIFNQFVKEIDKFLEHLDQLIELTERDKYIFDEEVLAITHEMNKNLFKARLHLNGLEGNKNRSLQRHARDIYSEVHRMYYEQIRPNALSLNDLDIPNLKLFAETNVEDNEPYYFKTSTRYEERYVNGLFQSLANLISFKSDRPIIDSPWNPDVQIEMSKELAELARDMRAIKIPEPNLNNGSELPESFTNFVIHGINETLDINIDPLQVYKALYAYDLKPYESLIDKLLREVENQAGLYNEPNTLDISNATEILLYIFLMRLKAAPLSATKQFDGARNFTEKLEVHFESKLNQLEEFKKFQSFHKLYENTLNTINNPFVRNSFTDKLRKFRPVQLNINQDDQKIFELDKKVTKKGRRDLIKVFNEVIKESNIGWEAEVLIKSAREITTKIYQQSKVADMPELTSRSTKYLRRISALVYHYFNPSTTAA